MWLFAPISQEIDSKKHPFSHELKNIRFIDLLFTLIRTQSIRYKGACQSGYKIWIYIDTEQNLP